MWKTKKEKILLIHNFFLTKNNMKMSALSENCNMFWMLRSWNVWENIVISIIIGWTRSHHSSSFWSICISQTEFTIIIRLYRWFPQLNHNQLFFIRNWQDEAIYLHHNRKLQSVNSKIAFAERISQFIGLYGLTARSKSWWFVFFRSLSVYFFHLSFYCWIRKQHVCKSQSGLSFISNATRSY